MAEFLQAAFRYAELNVTFYRLPKEETFNHWRRNSRAGFGFFVKGSRYITHLQRLNDPGPALRLFYRRALLLKE